ncbi:hypothetical protein PENTCL1PPCAC_21338, partial [Pristionchus entomophagus]
KENEMDAIEILHDTISSPFFCFSSPEKHYFAMTDQQVAPEHGRSRVLQVMRRALRIRQKEKEYVVATSDSTIHSKSKLQFKKGEKFLLKSTIDTTWWYVDRSGERGYVPSNYFVRESDIINFEWISFDMDKIAVEETLMKDEFETGAFIIRENEKSSISHSLIMSVK